ncbi:MAG: hypothetical protein J0L92_15775 [Deltaproteobacteria bacterium]|nr:hypothetical protein [Deltaproteobacteria bacterium]
MFDISSQIARGATSARRELALPTGWTMETPTRVEPVGAYRAGSSGEGAGLVLTRRWRTPSVFSALASAVTLDGFLAFWYATLIPLFFRSEGAREVLFGLLLFPLLFVAVGVWQTYSAIARLVNRTRLRVDSHTLTVRHQPLPWPGQREVSLEGVRAFFVRQIGPLGRPSEPWTVLADAGEPAARVVLERLSEEDARFVAARLAAHLRVEGP